MKYYLLHLSFFTLSLAVAFGCKNNPSNQDGSYFQGDTAILNPDTSKVLQNQSASVILPLAIGNTWVYKGITPVFDTTIVLSSDTSKGGLLYFLKISNYPSSYDTEGFINKTDGLWLNGTGEYSDHPAYYIFITYPAQPNKLYAQSPDRWHSRMTLTNDDTVITTPAGTFHTLKYVLFDMG